MIRKLGNYATHVKGKRQHVWKRACIYFYAKILSIYMLCRKYVELIDLTSDVSELSEEYEEEMPQVSFEVNSR